MSNQAAWIQSAKTSPLVVDTAPLAGPEPNEVIVHNAAVSVNPVDWKIQDAGYFVKTYPNILGTDAAGVVHQVGSAVTRFAPGDRVLAHACGLGTGQAKHGAFQNYITALDTLVAKIPEGMAFTDAVVLPLAISTAAAGLFQRTHLGLAWPEAEGGKSGRETLLVWGGASSVGAVTIQLAVAAGYEVVTTASERNFELVRSLGAKHVFDYTKEGVVGEIVVALKGTSYVGAYDAIGAPETWRACAEVTAKLGAATVVGTLPPPESGMADGVKASGLFALTIALDQTQVAEKVWGEYVPKALQNGSLKPKPDAIIVGKGLEAIQEGLNRQKAGVSAGKIVVEL